MRTVKAAEQPIDFWKAKLRGVDAAGILRVWRERADETVSWTREINFHVAAAERMKQLGNMAVDLDDKTRRALCRQAQEVIQRVQTALADDPERLAQIEELAAMSDAYYEKMGTKTARHYMMEQGVIDELGDRLLR